ncbi:GHKL domain-containing protein [bacterium]|nr:GHKL domain-containing protein [bacterium]
MPSDMSDNSGRLISFEDNMKIKGMIRKRRGLPLLLHGTGWIILFLLPQFLIAGGLFKESRTTTIILFNTFIFFVLFYVNYLWLVPRLAQKGKWFSFIILAASLIVVMGLASGKFYDRLFTPPPEVIERMKEEVQRNPHSDDRGRRRGEGMALYNFFITSFLVSGFAVGLRYAESALRKEEEIKELEREKLNSELALLKNQVSPHFFFNTLNNIYSLIEINQKDAQEAVLSLSKMMRYMLYESEQGNTRLSHEIEFMKGYIDLMQLRMSDRVRLTVDWPKEYDDHDLPPLLFIPFIENAFKHGVSYQGKAFIEISLRSEKDQITFTVRNSISGANGSAPRIASGIGLDNVRKRLGLLYPGRHELWIDERDSVFSVKLAIKT